MSRQMFYQSGKVLRFFVKRERFKLAVWIMSITAVNVLVALAFSGLYQSDEERQVMAETMENPAMLALVGRGYGLDDYTTGAMLSHQMLVITMVIVAVMSILLVTRLTRGDEENNQLEVLLALPVGRLSPSLSAILVLVFANGLLGFASAFGLAFLGLDSIDFIGSLAFGLALSISGIFFGSVTLLTAQLSNNQRGAMLLSYAVLGFSYMLRAVGDAGDLFISYLSPLGLLSETRAFVDNQFYPMAIILIFSILTIGVSLYLRERRDLGSGLLPDKKGKREAGKFLKTLPGFLIDQQKLPLYSWMVAMLLIGLSYGSVLGDLEGFLTENEVILQILGTSEESNLTEQFISVIMKVVAIIATIPAMMVFHRLKSEEKSARLDHFLARPLSRIRVFSHYIGFAFFTSILMLKIGIISLAGVGILVLDEPIGFMTMFFAQLVYLPAIWVVISLMVFIYGLLGKWDGLGWFYLLFSFLTIYLGDLLELPAFIMGISPFTHVPELPNESFTLLPLVILSLISVLLSMIGLYGFNRRDITDH